MPAYARGQIVVEDQVGVYHCIARCVRRAFLCGIDPYTGKDYGHRKDWILDRMRELAGLFAIEVCGYSVMSNHLHLVLRIRPDLAEQWSADEIALRWCRVFPPRDDSTGEPIDPGEPDLAMITANPEKLAERRASGEPVVVHEMLVREDCPRRQCRGRSSGRFWAGRFKSVALLDEAAILACSVYVDLTRSGPGSRRRPRNRQPPRAATESWSILENSTRLASRMNPACPRPASAPDAWLCELTLQETATSSRRATAARAAATPQESASPAGANCNRRHGRGCGVRAFGRFRSTSLASPPRRGPAAVCTWGIDQGFLPVSGRALCHVAGLDGRELARTSVGRFRIIWPRSWSG